MLSVYHINGFHEVMIRLTLVILEIPETTPLSHHIPRVLVSRLMVIFSKPCVVSSISGIGDKFGVELLFWEEVDEEADERMRMMRTGVRRIISRCNHF